MSTSLIIVQPLTRVDEKKVYSYSDSFRISRGVVQDDTTSPIFFILTLKLILELHDWHPRQGVDLGDNTIHTIGYTDDAALLDYDIEVV